MQKIIKVHLECLKHLVVQSDLLRGFPKNFFSKNPRLLWKWVGGSRSHSEFFFGKSSQNSLKPVLIFWSSIPCVFCLYTLLKVVGYYDLSVLSMSVMGFQKKIELG